MDTKIISCFTSSLIFFFVSLNLDSSCATDTISASQPLSGNKTIISQGGIFELGFFSPGNSQNYYIGIWYKRIQPQTVVWVANRESPLPNTLSELKISEDGNLVLVNSSKALFWSTDVTSVSLSNSTTAALLDTGNFILRQGSNPSAAIWQSFDHPTDTSLPGTKIGFNKKTGETIELKSWRSLEDPAAGPFSVVPKMNEQLEFMLMWNGSRSYWNSGSWKVGYYSNNPESAEERIQNEYNFNYNSDENGSYFSYFVKQTSLAVRFTVDVSTGQLQGFIWVDSIMRWKLSWSQPNDLCHVYSLCGPFSTCNARTLPFCRCLPGFQPKFLKQWNLNDRSGGCVRRTQLPCLPNNGSVDGLEHGFLKLASVKFPTDSIPVPSIGDQDECRLVCLSSCNCNAYAYSTSCLIWNGSLLNIRQLYDDETAGGDLYVRLAASEFQISAGSKAKIIWASACSAAGATLAVFGIIFTLYRKNKLREMNREIKEDHGHLIPFCYADLKAATGNFSERLGGGSFGSVFKGKLRDLGIVIAVKKLEGLRQGEKQFRTEVATLGLIQHINLVRLRGLCCKGNEKLLVYDFMPNGSLDHLLFSNESSSVLDWNARYQIALGVARGLTYLHDKCRDCIIHCDVKPENILLDAEFHPKVADFGMAKLLGHDFSRVITTVRGTIGYLAPEWISGLPVTAKADVYSFGMMLLEIISGRRNRETRQNRDIYYFPHWAATKTIEDEIFSVLDERLERIADKEELRRACRVACWCIQWNEASRPSMGEIVLVLEGVLELGNPPIPSHLQNLMQNEDITSEEYSLISS